MTVADYEARRILDDLRQQHAGPDWSTFTNQLERTLRDYADRRTIHAGMIRDVAEIAYGYVAEQLAAPTTERDQLAAKLQGVIERLEERLDQERERNAQWRKAVEEQRILREKREAADDGLIDVRFENSRRHWTVEDLEDIAYRLRLGGGSDDTVVEMSEWFARAKVVDPTLVSLDLARNPEPPRKPEPMRLDPPEYDDDRATGIASWSTARIAGVSVAVGIAGASAFELLLGVLS